MNILTRINIGLGILLAIAAAFAIGTDVDYTQPNVEFLPNMKRSPASDAFSANSILPKGRTLQASVVGTIARGDLPLYYAATKEDAVRAGEELQNPFAIDAVEDISRRALAPVVDDKNSETGANALRLIGDKPGKPAPPPVDPRAKFNAAVQRGAKTYNIFCVSCHGPKGAGDGAVAKRGFPPPPPLPTGKSAKMKDGQLFHILTYGQGSMSSMAAQLDRNRRWDVINYVRSMQQGAALGQPPAAGEPERTSKPPPISEAEPVTNP